MVNFRLLVLPFLLAAAEAKCVVLSDDPVIADITDDTRATIARLFSVKYPSGLTLGGDRRVYAMCSNRIVYIENRSGTTRTATIDAIIDAITCFTTNNYQPQNIGDGAVDDDGFDPYYLATVEPAEGATDCCVSDIVSNDDYIEGDTDGCTAT